VGTPEHGVVDWRTAPPIAQATKSDPGAVPEVVVASGSTA